MIMLTNLFHLRKPTRRDFLQALERAGRAFGVAFAVLYPLGNIADSATHWVSGDDVAVIDIDLAKKASLAGLMAAGSFLLRFFLPDWFRSLPPSPAADNPPNAAVAAAEAAGEPAPPVDDVPPPDEAA